MQATGSNRRAARRQKSALPKVVPPGPDPYVAPDIIPGVAACPSCAAVYKDNKWRWGSRPMDAPQIRCPACQRVADRMPAALVYVQNSMISTRRDEVFALVRNVESMVTRRHPLQRIIEVRDEHLSVSITTTGEHIAECIASAIAGITRSTITTRVDEETVTLVVA